MKIKLNFYLKMKDLARRHGATEDTEEREEKEKKKRVRKKKEEKRGLA